MYCERCGKCLDEGARFCASCGARQSWAAEADARPAKDKGGGKKHVAVVAVAIAVALVLAAAGVWLAFGSSWFFGGDEPAAEEGEADAADESVEAVALEDAQVGDVVEFGTYAQEVTDTGSAYDTQEAIRWYVLDIVDGNALLLTEQAIECMRMAGGSYSTWADSEIRAWLNDTFAVCAFTEDEQAKLCWTTVTQSDASDGDTLDQVFLLSVEEAEQYLTEEQKVATATTWAQASGADTKASTGTVCWWLRDYNDKGKFTIVFNSGDVGGVSSDGETWRVFYEATVTFSVRPAVWVSVEGLAGDVVGSEGDTGLNDGGTTVTLTVEAADGTILSGEVTRDADGYVIADSTTREYTKEELEALNLTDAELSIARNELFARQGYHFKNSGLREYFEALDWYTDTGNESYLTGAAETNCELLLEIANERDSGELWTHLSTE